MSEEHIFRVSFNDPPLAGDPCKDFYFHSLSAIYEAFDEKQVGCKVSRLWNIGVTQGATYEGRLCRVTRETIRRKKRIKAPQKAETARDNNLHENEK